MILTVDGRFFCSSAIDLLDLGRHAAEIAAVDVGGDVDDPLHGVVVDRLHRSCVGCIEAMSAIRVTGEFGTVSSVVAGIFGLMLGAAGLAGRFRTSEIELILSAGVCTATV